MYKYLAAALAIAVAIGPASALDVGVGVGGIGVSAGVGVGSNGASVGVGVSVGGANVGASVGTSNGSLGANVGANVGGLSVGLGAGDESAAGGAAPSGTTSGGTTGPASVGASKKTAAAAVTRGVRQASLLPRRLRPFEAGRNTVALSTLGYPMLRVQVPLKAIPGTPPAVVRVCRQAIISAARPLGAVRVSTASAGPLRRHRRGALTAPIEVRIDYVRQGGIEVRQARVGCRLDAAGRVVAVI